MVNVEVAIEPNNALNCFCFFLLTRLVSSTLYSTRHREPSYHSKPAVSIYGRVAAMYIAQERVSPSSMLVLLSFWSANCLLTVA
jgi:hypothetical protein